MKFLIPLFSALALAACGSEPPPTSHGHETAAEEPAKGPHRGRMLVDGDFAIELAIFETGVPPEYRAWPTLGGKPLPLPEVQLTVELTRLGDKRDLFRFKPEGDYLRGDGVVREPHSFSVKVTAQHAGQSHQWSYDSFEGRTSIAAKIAEEAGIKTEIAGPATLTETVTLYGQVSANPERRREVSARFPGLIRSVHKQLGDTVKQGEVLAVIESNESLKTYELIAPQSGVISARNANTGEETGGRVLFSLTDPRSLVAELSVFPRDRARVKPGAAVQLRLADSEAVAEGRVRRVDVQAGANQAVIARVDLESPDARFLPGSFVTGEVAVMQRAVPLAVRTAGLQAFRDFTVVYAQVGETYEVRMLELAAPQGEWVEVLGGLEPGERYVTEGSYLIKADIEKSGASHDH